MPAARTIQHAILIADEIFGGVVGDHIEGGVELIGRSAGHRSGTQGGSSYLRALTMPPLTQGRFRSPIAGMRNSTATAIALRTLPGWSGANAVANGFRTSLLPHS